MLQIEKQVVYKAFGLFLISEIYLPELPQIDNEVDHIDVEVKIEDFTSLWSEFATNDQEFTIHDHIVMYKIAEIGLFTILEGRRIFVTPMKEYDEDVARLVILGTCMGAILMQRKIFPLHGSAIAINGKAYAIIGESGAGKSTLATAFLKKGYQLLTDDVIAVSLSNDKVPYVTPSYPQQKLWQKSLEEFGMESTGYQPLYRREAKFSIPVPSQFLSNSLPLAGVFELVKADCEQIEMQQIDKLRRFETLFHHTYRNFLISRLGLMGWHFNLSAKIVSQIEMFQLQRPISHFTADQLVSQIIGTINGEGNK